MTEPGSDVVLTRLAQSIPSPSSNTSPQPPTPPRPIEPPAPRDPETCPRTWEPSLEPLPAPTIHAHNSARRVQSIRKKIERVDIMDPRSFRVLFSLDPEVVQSLHRAPDGRKPDWDPERRPGSSPAWDIGVLVYVAGDPLPYLGHVFDNWELYFVDEADPWDPAPFVYDDDDTDNNGDDSDDDTGDDTDDDDDDDDDCQDCERARNLYGIPTGPELYDALEQELGEEDPFGKNAREAQREEDRNCRLGSRPSGETFPQLPKAVIEPVDD